MTLSGFFLYALIGLMAGGLAGFFGLGGGLVIVPALVYFAGFSQHRATGTSLAALLLPIGAGAVMEYYKKGHVDLRAAAVIAATLALSAWATAHFANKVSETHLRMAFGLFVCAAGIAIVVSAAGQMGR
jgi:hypothetical protein